MSLTKSCSQCIDLGVKQKNFSDLGHFIFTSRAKQLQNESDVTPTSHHHDLRLNPTGGPLNRPPPTPSGGGAVVVVVNSVAVGGLMRARSGVLRPSRSSVLRAFAQRCASAFA